MPASEDAYARVEGRICPRRRTHMIALTARFAGKAAVVWAVSFYPTMRPFRGPIGRNQRTPS